MSHKDRWVAPKDFDKPRAKGPFGPTHPQNAADYLKAQHEAVLREAAEDKLGKLMRNWLRDDGAICYVFERGRKYRSLPANADTKPREPYHNNH